MAEAGAITIIMGKMAIFTVMAYLNMAANMASMGAYSKKSPYLRWLEGPVVMVQNVSKFFG